MIAALILSLLVLTGMPAADQDRESFARRIVELHDVERLAVGSPRIEWDEDLARDAATWGRELARSDRFDHDPSDHGQGENLWMGTRGRYRLDQMIGAWMREKHDLRGLGSWDDDVGAVGHYLQMIWSGTRRVGCAVTSNASDEFLVCRYDPPGNWTGESPYSRGR